MCVCVMSDRRQIEVQIGNDVIRDRGKTNIQSAKTNNVGQDSE